jgi:hypothetical protein
MILPFPAGMSLTKLILEKLVNDTLVGDGKIDYLFYTVGPSQWLQKVTKKLLYFHFVS